ncbi:MAG: DUF2855 family protein [Acidobacteria bacterium]|nr:DUF2855 family protein [Acidobacteriota bacterium]
MDIEIKRADLAQHRLIEAAPAPLAEGQARLRVDAFALTTNNITYGVFGDMLRYWAVFPASDEPEVWGRIPTWGFAECIESRSADLAVGERIYGFMPMSTEFVMTPGRATERSLFDVAEHRHGLAGTYNSYQRCATDPAYRADREAHQMLLYPLFVTSFIIDDFLIDHEDFGTEQIIISSASAKTAIGAALLGHRRGQRIVGLTSAGNAAFVESLGVYDSVVTYEDVATIDRVPSVYVDIAGNQDVLFALHTHLDGVLRHSMVVGNTNWSAETTADISALPAPAPEFLFAPTQLAKRTQEWGREGLDARMGEAWQAYADWTDTWLTFHEHRGTEAVLAAWERIRTGTLDPATGDICSLTTGDTNG